MTRSTTCVGWREHLHALWMRLEAERSRSAAQPRAPGEFGAEMTLLDGLGVGLRESYAFVLERRPTFDAFVDWVAETGDGDAERLARLDAALAGASQAVDAGAEPVLSADDLAHFDERGYVVVRDAIGADACAATVDAVWAFLGMERDDPETWYGQPFGHSVWVPLFHHPAVTANRRSPRAERAYRQLWRREDVWALVDQVGFNPPERPGWTFPGPHLHWDASLAQPHAFGLQGILYLVDVASDQGAFSCIPGFHRKLGAWLASLPPGADPRACIRNEPGAVTVPGRAGDLVIWHHALPHGASPNRNVRPRIVQYLTLRPSLWEGAATWI